MVELIGKIAVKFRCAIDSLKEEGYFEHDNLFWDFPRGCCDATSDLLSEVLIEHNISTYSVHGRYWKGTKYYGQPHTWLVTENNIIIDITGDQFKSYLGPLRYKIPVYVGYEDRFHKLFDVKPNDVIVNNGLNAYCGNQKWFDRMTRTYNMIVKQIEENEEYK